MDKDLWLEDAKGLREFYNKIDSVGNRMPKELWNQLDAFEARLSK